MFDQLKPYIIAVAAAALLFAGWTGRGWYEDSKDLAAANAVEKARDAMIEVASGISQKTEGAIKGIRIENRTIYNETSTQIVEKPIYRACVIPEDDLARINRARGADK